MADRDQRSADTVVSVCVSISVFPFLDDLLYFEWMEIEIHNMPDRPNPEFTDQGDLLNDRLVFNPEHEIIKLEYPVHMHPADTTPELKGDYYALIFRAPETGYVHFLDLSALNVYILSNLMEEDIPLINIKGDIARTTGIESDKYLDEALSKFIGDLMEKKMKEIVMIQIESRILFITFSVADFVRSATSAASLASSALVILLPIQNSPFLFV